MRIPTLSTAVIALSLFAASITARPTPPPKTPNLSRLATLYPKSDLTAPTGLQLKFVGLGIGTQNYTCLSDDETAVPGTTGALATLYDIGTKLNTDPGAKWKISTISGLALSFYSQKKLLDNYLTMQGYQRVLGEHFFTQTVPTFSLNKVLPLPFPLAYVTKDEGVDAPKSSCPGTKNEGAIQWLKLSDKEGRSQGGVNTVYRLITAGGNKPPACRGQKQTFEVPYAAQYWVYGPKS